MSGAACCTVGDRVSAWHSWRVINLWKGADRQAAQQLNSCRLSQCFLRADDAGDQASHMARSMLSSQVEQPSSLLLAAAAT